MIISLVLHVLYWVLVVKIDYKIYAIDQQFTLADKYCSSAIIVSLASVYANSHVHKIHVTLQFQKQQTLIKIYAPCFSCGRCHGSVVGQHSV